MKMTVNELRSIVKDVIIEAKKKKEKADSLKKDCQPAGFKYADSLDFSSPLGAYNLYKHQGAAVNWGPMTGSGQKIDDTVGAKSEIKELKEFVNNLKNSIPSNSEWNVIVEGMKKHKLTFNNIWEAALHRYDNAVEVPSKKKIKGVSNKKSSARKNK